MRSRDLVRQVKQTLSDPEYFAPSRLREALYNALVLVNRLAAADLSELPEAERDVVNDSIARAQAGIDELEREIEAQEIGVRFLQIPDSRLSEIILEVQSVKNKTLANAALRDEIKGVKEASVSGMTDAELLDRMMEADRYTPEYLAGDDIESPKDLLQQTAETLRGVEQHIKAFAEPIRAAAIDDLILGIEQDAANIDWSEFEQGRFIYPNEQEQTELQIHADADDPEAEQKVALYREQQFARHKAVEAERRRLEADTIQRKMKSWPRARLIEKLVNVEVESTANAMAQKFYLNTVLIAMVYGCEGEDPHAADAAWAPLFQPYDEPLPEGGLRGVSPEEQLDRLSGEPPDSLHGEFLTWLQARCLERMSDRARLVARSLQFRPSLVTEPR